MSDRGLLADLVLSRGTLDRSAHLREDESWVKAQQLNPGARFMWVCEGAAAVIDDALILTRGGTVDAECTFLGLDGEGIAYFAAHVDDHQDAQVDPNCSWAQLRQIGGSLSARDAGMMVTAVAIDNWMRTHRRCPRCGEITRMHHAGWSRICTSDGTEHFPRTDPAIIVLVTDDQDRALLGRQASWAPGWFSTLAGFVEGGESAEAALRREVQEESGVIVGTDPGDITFLGSQPWPFPCSLMLGFHAKAADPTIAVDGTEIAEARWFTREELEAECIAGRVQLPSAISISRKLIERWFGSELPGEWSRN